MRKLSATAASDPTDPAPRGSTRQGSATGSSTVRMSRQTDPTRPPGPRRNTLVTMPASAVSITAATGAKKAAKGICIGSLPVSNIGR